VLIEPVLIEPVLIEPVLIEPVLIEPEAMELARQPEQIGCSAQGRAIRC
jgi:hypothetical protein